ncbi:MAG: replication protein [Clostridiaceae bacterium]|nr:replication protein [Clostridiaceae bacterium]
MSFTDELIASLEGGFTQTPNTFIEAINKSKLSKTQMAICYHIIRCTYGWHKKTAVISHQEFAEECGTYRQKIGRELPGLIDHNVVICFNKTPFQPSSYMMNHNIHSWSPMILDQRSLSANKQPKAKAHLDQVSCANMTLQAYPDMHEVSCDNITPHAHPAVHERAYQDMHGEASSVLENTTSQRPLNKELNKLQIQSNKDSNYEEEEYKLAKLLYESVRMNYPGFNVYDIEKWSYVMRKMIKYDKRDPETIKQAIYFARQDEYYLEHMFRPEEFRGRFDSIIAAMGREERRKAKIASTYGSRSYIEKDEDPKEDKYAFFFERKL